MIRSSIVLSILAVALLVAPASAYTAVGGGKGLLRVQDALVDEPGLNVTLHIIGRSVKNYEGLSGTAYVGDLVAPSLHYIPYSSRYFGAELFGSWGGVFQYATLQGVDKKYQMGLHDLRAGAKLSIPVIPVLKLGGAAAYSIKLRDATQFYLDPDAGLPYDGDDKLSWSGLATLRFQDLASSAPNLMVNYGKAGDRTNYGAGVELAATGFALFAELQSLQPASSAGPLDKDGQLRLTPGIRFGQGDGSATTLAFTFGWGPGVPNSINLGFNWATPFGRKAPARFGNIAGVVTNKKTGAPLAATISFPENEKLAAVTADPATGAFSVKKLAVGDVMLKAEAEGYMPVTVPVQVEQDKTASYQFELLPLVTYGVIAGSVNDATNGRPLQAKLEFPGSELQAMESDAASGAFKLENVPVGAYTITASAEGYFPVTQTVSVVENGVATPTFVLSPTSAKSIVSGQVTDRGTGSGLAAKIIFKDPTSGAVVAEVKTEPATGVYVANVAAGTYAATASAEGYIDQSAAVAAEKDKTTKQDFALVKPGTKVTLRNIYFDYDKATIKMPQSKEALDAAAKILTDNPTIRVEIQGHTDSDGSDAYNQKLSERRAMSVVTYLVQNYGIAMARLNSVGYGEAQPVADNGTAEGKAMNRRVEFVVLGE